MSRRKWRDSGVFVKSMASMMDCLSSTGGVMVYGKFWNRARFFNLPIATAVNYMDTAALTYPILAERTVAR